MTDEPPVLRQLMRMSPSIMGAILFTVIQAVVDNVLVGHLDASTLSLTAIGFAIQLWALLEAPAEGLGVAVMAVMARAFGAQDRERVSRVLGQAIQLTLLTGVILAVITAAVAHPVLRTLGASPDVADLGARYLRAVLVGVPAEFLSIGLRSAMRGATHTRLPLLVGIVVTVVNIALASCLMFGLFGLPALGIVGAGIGTAIAMWVGALLLLYFTYRGAIDGVVLRVRDVFTLDAKLMRQTLRIAAPSVGENLIFFGSVVATVWLLASEHEVGVAAHSIGARLFPLLLVPVLGLTAASGALVGNALGAKDVDRARRVVRITASVAVAVATTFAVAMLVFPRLFLIPFDVEPSSMLAHDATIWIRLLGCSLPPAAIYLAYSSLLRGAGETRTTMLVDLLSVLAIQMPGAWVLAFPLGLGAFGVWLSFPISMVVKAALVYAAYRRGRWAVTGVEL